jgi:superfamily II RNA helicase
MGQDRHIMSPAPSAPLSALLPENPGPESYDQDTAYADFAEWAEGRGLPLYPAQDEAMMELVSGASVVLSTPTGTGKSLVAAGAHFVALSQGRRTYYTAPIKALVSEKFFALVELFGPEKVGMVTGDSSVNADAPIICCTAEILANLALRHGSDADVDQVVMDEFHFYGDQSRGWAWQVPLLLLDRAQFLLMSATLGDVTRLVDDLSRRTGRPVALLVRPDPRAGDRRRTALHQRGPRLRRALLAGRRARARAGPVEHQGGQS